MYVSLREVSNVANNYAARKMFDEGVAAFEEFEIVNHLMAMRLTHFDKKVPSDLAI